MITAEVTLLEGLMHIKSQINSKKLVITEKINGLSIGQSKQILILEMAFRFDIQRMSIIFLILMKKRLMFMTLFI